MRCRFLRRGRAMFFVCVFVVMTIVNLSMFPRHVRRHYKQQDYNTYIGMATGFLRWMSGTEHHVFGAVIRPIWGNYEPRAYGLTSGHGENGRAVKIEPWEKDAVERSIITYSFNQYSSDKIGLDRTIPDLRKEECKHWHYPHQLPNASVIISFHNEGWSTLLRTIRSVINRTPSILIQEIILVDDASTMVHLQLSTEVIKPEYRHLVKLFRNDKRKGVIASRVLGARKARGQTIVFLDSHCEVGLNWLPPLLTVVKANRTTVAVPILDIIDSINLMMYPQSQGALARGMFDWSLDYKRVGGLPENEAKVRRYETEPYRSPVLAGGVLAIDKEYFFAIGAFDPGLEMWGGENYELSFKVWMCGGSLVWVPCSRVGHMYRVNGRPPYSFPKGTLQSYRDKNYARVAEVWMDGYKQYFYATKSYLHSSTLQLGDLRKEKEFRATQKCKKFRWFIENIASDLLKHFPLPPLPLQSGEIRTYNSLCMDTRGVQPGIGGGRVGVYKCHGQGGNQFFHLTTKGDLRVNDYCLCKAQTFIILCSCDDDDDVIRDWTIDPSRHMISHQHYKLCLTRKFDAVILANCVDTNRDQTWTFVEHAKKKSLRV
ncbi:N-acetylgalactosaminyltransferase 7-like [Anneissia japonica]|uniref:N-acetylgalactosaminyltransferase 7-like n=1 Tax=Anneissia japonica TaxID=1529436 RepID=UPI0014254E73|nr:N-acetylgalactosaminyltransferase 7-like [Anneissia japonica]XP_033116256.1 N-acetylgalactosaminyltransferase 7-like [Anneissia japonica]